MRSLILISAVLLFASQAAWAGGESLSCCPPSGYVGLFADELHTQWCIYGTGIFTFYCFVLPSATGLDCVELRITLSSSNIWVFNAVYHPDVLMPILGGVPGDMAACFASCWYEWIYVFRATVYVMTATQEMVSIDPFTGSPYPKILDCTGIETEAYAYTNLYINILECYPTSVRESTWGAIKNMYE